MNIDHIKTLGVLGCGQMGAGVAHVAALVGYRVLLCDADYAIADKAREGIHNRLDRQLSKEQITKSDRDAALDNLIPVEGIGSFAEADFVVEAVSENEELKKDLFRRLDEVCREGVVLASNTSSISITRVAAVTRRQGKVIGMHFMNPVPVMKLCEIIGGLSTDETTYAITVALAKRLGKTTVVSKDMPGFIVNRVLMPMLNEAVFALHEGVATAADIDTAMKLGTNQPMGPLALADLIGLDTCLSIMEVLWAGLGESKYRPCPLLRQHVDAGYLGRKSGRGFYIY